MTRIFWVAMLLAMLPFAVGAEEVVNPPPRSVADITALLDQDRPDPARAARLRDAASAQPPAGADAGRLIAFYKDRGLAAGAIGRGAQAITDFREALRLAQANPGVVDLAMLYQHLSYAEFRAGHKREGLAERLHQVEALRASGEKIGRLASAYAVVVRNYADYGDLAQATHWLEQERALLVELRSKRKGYESHGQRWESFLAAAEAAVASRFGRLGEAEQAYRRQIGLLAGIVGASDENDLEDMTSYNYDMARVLLAERVLVPAGRILEAEVLVRQALIDILKRRGRYTSETADILQALAGVIAEQGRYDDAGRLVRAAIDVYEKTGHDSVSGALARARARLGGIQAEAGRASEALATFDALDRGLVGAAEIRAVVLEANPHYGEALLAGGRAAAAVAVFERAANERARLYGADHPGVAVLRGQLALARAAAGDREGALTTFRAAVPRLIGSGGGDEADDAIGGRARRRHAVLEGYLSLLADRLGGGGDPALVAEAFAVADAARGQAVQKAVAAATARLAVGGGELGGLVRREQDTGARLMIQEALLADHLSSPANQRDAGVIRSLESDIAGLRTARGALREEIQGGFPRYAALRHPPPATLDQARSVLHSGEALVALLVGERRTLVWAVPASGAPAFAVVPLGRAQVATLVTTLRGQLDPGSDILASMPVYDVATAYQVYQALLAPVAAGWVGARSLLVVPDKALAQLPFTVLVTEPYRLPAAVAGEPLFTQYRGVPWLVRKAAVVQLPSVNALLALRGAPPGTAAPKAFIGFGDPWFNTEQAAEGVRERGLKRGAEVQPQSRGVRSFQRRAIYKRGAMDTGLLKRLPRLPETVAEVEKVAVALGADPVRDVFLGDRVNERTLATLVLNDRRVVMFATHGLIPGDISGLTQPALALSAPEVTGLASGSGLLTLDKVLGLKLNADWVVLSACNTASGDGAGAEAVSGLGRAFFYAGSRALLVTHWPVESTSAAALTTGLFRYQADHPSESRAEALRATELKLIETGLYREAETGPPVFSYAHPAFWAPYSLIGDGG